MSEYTCTEARFQSDVAHHSMTVLRDDGVDRHLRFRFAGGGFRWFDIVTWKGRLVITGDCETFVFSRLDDMFEFFRSSGDRINPGYWQEKILDGRDRAVGFDVEQFRDEVRQRRVGLLRAWKANGMGKDDRQELWGAVESEVIEMIDDQHEAVAHACVSDFAHYWYDKKRQSHRIKIDTDEWPQCQTFDFHYIWCCRAIVWAIQQYDQHHAAQAATIPTEGS